MHVGMGDGTNKDIRIVMGNLKMGDLDDSWIGAHGDAPTQYSPSESTIYPTYININIYIPCYA